MSLRASAAYFFIRGVAGALAVATVSLFAHMLGPPGYARLAVTLALSALLGGMLIQPLHSALARFLPPADHGGVVPTLGRLLLLAGAGSLPLAALIEWLAPAWFPPGAAFLALGVAIPQAIFDFAAQHASSTLQPVRYGWLYLFKAAFALLSGFLFLRAGAGLIGAVSAMALGFLGATVVFGRQAWLEVWHGSLDRRLLPKLKAYALPVSVGLLAGSALQWSDRLILAAYTPNTQLGAYGAAADLVQQGFGLVSMAFLLAWFPRLVAAWERHDPVVRTQFDHYARLLIGLLAPAAIGLALVAGDLAALVLGAVYRPDAERVIPWLSAATFVGCARMYLFDLPLYLSRRMGTLSSIVGGSAALSVVLNLRLVPQYGILGAAVVALVAQTIGWSASYYFGRRTLLPRIPARDLLGIAAGCAAVAACVLALPSGSPLRLLVRVSMGGAIYGAVLLLTDAAGIRTWLVNHLRVPRWLS